MAEKKIQNAVRATEAEWAEIDAHAAKIGISRSEFLRRAGLAIARGELVAKPRPRVTGDLRTDGKARAAAFAQARVPKSAHTPPRK